MAAAPPGARPPLRGSRAEVGLGRFRVLVAGQRAMTEAPIQPRRSDTADLRSVGLGARLVTCLLQRHSATAMQPSAEGFCYSRARTWLKKINNRLSCQDQGGYTNASI